MYAEHDEAGHDEMLLARYLKIRHTIPDQLDLAANLVRDAVESIYSSGLQAAFPFGSALCDVAADELTEAARRIREAAERIGVPNYWTGYR